MYLAKIQLQILPYQCSFEIVLLQHDFKAANQCDLNLRFHCGLRFHLTELNASCNEIAKSSAGTFSKVAAT